MTLNGKFLSLATGRPLEIVAIARHKAIFRFQKSVFFDRRRHPPTAILAVCENKELLNQHLESMPSETRYRMENLIRLVTEREECALCIIRQIESGRISPSCTLWTPVWAFNGKSTRTQSSMSVAARDIGQSVLGENQKILNFGDLMYRISVGMSVFQVFSF